MDNRVEQAREFLNTTNWANACLEPLAGDASARRYFRLSRKAESAILMDAPPIDGQDVRPFLDVGSFLESQGLCPPKVLAADRLSGFILLEDLGDAIFANVVLQNPTEENPLYEAATDVLIALDKGPVPEFVPEFSASTMAEQVAPFFEWYLGDTAFQDRFQATLETVLNDCFDGPGTLLLRDFHAENLIWLPERPGLRRVGLLDFQDAMVGPSGYDLVSLLLDARRDVSAPVVNAMITRFAKGTGRDVSRVQKGFAVIGAQRNLRILGVFARLARLHGKPRYLEFVPRVWRHVQTSLANPALVDLAQMLDGTLPEPTRTFLQDLAKTCD